MWRLVLGVEVGVRCGGWCKVWRLDVGVRYEV